MLSLDAIAIEGFRSYINDRVFQYPGTPGLYMVTGAIGAGKSTLFEAVRWVLTGALSSGLRAKQVACWLGECDTVVSLDFLQGGRLRNVTRRFSPNNLTFQIGVDEPRVIEQAEIDRVLGLPAVRLLDAAYISQRGASFMDVGAARQGACVSAALGLECWDARVVRARAAAKEAAGLIRQSELRMAELRGELAAVAESLRQLLAASKAFDAKAEGRRRVEQLRLWVRGKEANWRRRVEEHRDASERRRGLARELDEAVSDVDRATPDEQCGVCGAPTSGVALERMRQNHSTAECHEKEVRARFDAATVGVAELQAVLTAAEGAVRDAREYLQGGLDGNAVWEQEIAAIEVEVLEANPHRQGIKDAAAVRTRVKDDLASIAEATAAHQRALEVATVAAKEFPRVKLMILERACARLSTLTTNALGQLGFVGWGATWSTTAELSNGELRPKFAMTVRSPDSPEWVDWRAWSGGQATVLRIAGAAAYVDLVRSRMKNPPDFEFWDEPGEFLDEKVGSKMMAFFRHRAHSLDLKVWVVDHNMQFAGDVDRVWKVELDHMGSHIQGA